MILLLLGAGYPLMAARAAFSFSCMSLRSLWRALIYASTWRMR